jgi:hypothetical protein
MASNALDNCINENQALALYLLLVTAADSQGLSFYSDKTATRLLCISEAELRQARLGLLQAGLIAYELGSAWPVRGVGCSVLKVGSRLSTW